jgi:hypothetical protein
VPFHFAKTKLLLYWIVKYALYLRPLPLSHAALSSSAHILHAAVTPPHHNSWEAGWVNISLRCYIVAKYYEIACSSVAGVVVQSATFLSGPRSLILPNGPANNLPVVRGYAAASQLTVRSSSPVERRMR